MNFFMDYNFFEKHFFLKSTLIKMKRNFFFSFYLVMGIRSFKLIGGKCFSEISSLMLPAAEPLEKKIIQTVIRPSFFNIITLKNSKFYFFKVMKTDFDTEIHFGEKYSRSLSSISTRHIRYYPC